MRKISKGERITLSDRLVYLWGRLFAPKEVYLHLYPNLAKHKWLYPVCVIRRMFRGLFRAEKFWNELKLMWKIKE